jgi:flagellar biosynthetic protein FliP
MSKLKKGYCVASVIFAALVIVFTMTISFPGTVNATTVNPNGTIDGTITGDDIKDLQMGNDGEAADAKSDINNGFSINYNNEDGTLSAPLKILLVLTVISLAPSILIMLTSFTRIVIVLHFVRAAIGTQTVPPNQILVGLALFLTLFIMAPIFTQINETAIQPLDRGEITQEEALEIGMEPLREFMFSQTQTKDINLFCDIQGTTYETREDITTGTLIPAFILSELRTAFIIGFLIYIPFIVIDMVVASVLMSMGMMMLPPTTISMPFKILLFILADGWDLVVGNLVRTFY